MLCLFFSLAQNYINSLSKLTFPLIYTPPINYDVMNSNKVLAKKRENESKFGLEKATMKRGAFKFM